MLTLIQGSSYRPALRSLSYNTNSRYLLDRDIQLCSRNSVKFLYHSIHEYTFCLNITLVILDLKTTNLSYVF